MPSIGGIPVGVQIMNTKEDVMPSDKVRSPKPLKDRGTDTFAEIMEGLENLGREITYILENASPSGKPFNKRQKEIIRSSMLGTFRDQADEALVMYCFGDADYGLDSLNNLKIRMERFGEVTL